MAILKCKMCGGDLVINESSSIAVCEYCGTQQTVPNADNEKKLTLFQRANRLRFSCEFDKAAGIYETIVAEFPEEAEAYWGLLLCKYGIEYVDDPATAKKIPTCHRSSFESIMDDSDFEQVMENADVIARGVYRQEAKQIEELRKRIIEVSSKEEPYDIFICYKETAPDGDRTIDSVIAQDVYDALTEKGYRVFFSRITLEDKLGQEYEPYIFAALNSAKIMLAFGTDYEYYNAVWVKNEWSRFLQLIAKGEKKTLVPCYKNIDAYDMPKEFAKLQAQDMGKVGAIQDLLKGINKILPIKTEQKNEQADSQLQVENINIDSILNRGYISLEDKDYSEAKVHFNKVLDINSEYAHAYLGLALADVKVSTLNDFAVRNRFNNRNYQRAKKFADKKLLEQLNNLEKDAERLLSIKHENDRLEREKAEREREEKARLAKEKAIREEEQAQRALENKMALAEKVRRRLDCEDGVRVAVRPDGTVMITGNDDISSSVARWRDIVAVATSAQHTVGLKSDGTVVAVGNRKTGACDVDSWRDIVQIAAGDCHTVGLKSDGTVVSTSVKGMFNKFGQDQVTTWSGIKYISACSHVTIGIRKDGSVISCGHLPDSYGSFKGYIKCVSADVGYNCAAALFEDGQVYAFNPMAQEYLNTDKWQNVVQISVGFGHIVGLKSDGRVVACGKNEHGECDVNSWRDIAAIVAGPFRTIGVKKDGTILQVGYVNSDLEKWRLFNSVDTFEEELLKAKPPVKKLDSDEQREAAFERRRNNLCQHCGGDFKGLFSKKCEDCGQPKDY